MHPARKLFCLVCIVMVSFQRASAESFFLPSDDEYDWQETRTTNFSIIYPAEYEQLASLVVFLGPNLDFEYERLSALFDTTLLSPISIRIYPTVVEFQKLNPLAIIPDDQMIHSHIGVREIVLIAQNMVLANRDWRQDGLNAIRYELAVLFVQNLTDKKAPVGLLMGIGSYAQDPGYLFDSLDAGQKNVSSPPNWRSLWEGTNLLNNPMLNIDVSSMVAFLVDVYGWPSFLEFLTQLSTNESPRRAFIDVYGLEQVELQNQWINYYPLYIESEGAANILYGYDLTPYHRLIEAGAYTEAASKLPSVIAFLDKLKNEESVKRAQSLLDQARLGQEGNRMALEARRSLQNREYELSIFYVDQASDIFSVIADSRRADELDSYRSIAQEIINLNNRLEQIEIEVSLSDDPGSSVPELLNINRRMVEIGDSPGLARVNRLISTVQDRQNEQLMVKQWAGLGVVLLLIILRIWILRWKKPAAAQLT
jgi:hypothetical protein